MTNTRSTLWHRLQKILERGVRSAGDGIDALLTPIGLDRQSRREVAFTTGLIALAAKMARADGVVTRDEISAFDQIMDIPESERANVERLFALAQEDVAGFEHYARRLQALFADEPDTLVDILDALFHVAKADGLVHEREISYLSSVAAIFGLTEARFEQILSVHTFSGAQDPYMALGLAQTASDTELRARYRALVREAHPDTMHARGVPDGCVKLANERLAAINKAYDAITRQRKMRREHAQ